MDQELFNPQSSSVSSSRIIYTPSTFARTSLLHLQEVGSLQAFMRFIMRKKMGKAYRLPREDFPDLLTLWG